jgi:hypothetical protein
MAMWITDHRGNRRHVQGYPWTLGGRHAVWSNARAEKEAVQRRGYDAKIRRLADGTYQVKRRARSKRFEERLKAMP